MKTPLITAHTGCENTEDNSADSLRTALLLLPDAVEVDVRRAKNGNLVLSHDAEESESRCTLAQALDLVLAVPELHINCDLKEPGLEHPVLELAQSKGALDRVILTGSVNADAVGTLQNSVQVYLNLECLFREVYRKKADHIYAGGGEESMPLSRQELDVLFREAEQRHVKVLNLNYRFCTDEMIARAGEKGIGLSLWTVDDPPLLRKLISMAPHNITTRTVRAALLMRDEPPAYFARPKEGQA